MKAILTFVFAGTLCFTINPVHAQSNTTAVSERAIIFADSLLQSFRQNNLDQYTELSYPGVVSYYGGHKNFREFVQRARTISNEASSENIRLVQLLNNTSEWQCVVEKTSATIIDGKKAHVISYLVGQSKDEGQHWTFFDVAFNSVDNLVYIMPDIFDRLSIPQRQILFDNNNHSGNM